MKILIVCSKNAGYISPFVTEQAKALMQQGVEIDYSPIIGKGFWGYLKNYFSLKNKIKSFKPDLIHAHYGLSGALAVIQRMVPVVITFHDGETHTIVANIISSTASLFAVHNIYVAQHIYDRCYFKNKIKYTILACGIDFQNIEITEKTEALNETGLDKNKKHIIFGGAFDNLRKNYPLVKEAVALLPELDIHVIEMKGLNRVQISKLMCAADLFILPSKSEGSPQALKEAMACNCPIVATDIADIKYLFGKLEGCYLCSYDPKVVAKKIKLAFDFNNRTKGRDRIIELGLDDETVAKRILEIYGRLVPQAPKGDVKTQYVAQNP